MRRCGSLKLLAAGWEHKRKPCGNAADFREPGRDEVEQKSPGYTGSIQSFSQFMTDMYLENTSVTMENTSTVVWNYWFFISKGFFF